MAKNPTELEKLCKEMGIPYTHLNSEELKELTDAMKEKMKVTEEKPKLRCPNCKATLSYLAVRSMFYVGRVSGEPHYTNNQNDFRCPFCNHCIAASEELAIERLKEGYRK